MTEEIKPSHVKDVYWLFAERKVGEYPEYTARAGKWLIFVSAYNLDSTDSSRLVGDSWQLSHK
ncbi:MAG TPA: hypothetical protein VF974_00415 [Patescibacteria group bacterium]